MTTDIIRVSELIRRSADRHPDRIAVEDLEGSQPMTYRTLWYAVERGASVLGDLGLGPGERVLLPLAPEPRWVAAFLAIAHADLVAVPIPATTPAPLARLAASFVSASAWIGDGRGGQAAPLISDLPCVTTSELFDRPARPFAPRPVRPGATAVVVFTSGSTARPRAVALGHEGLRANLRSLMAVRHAGPGETVLSTLPPSHAYELVAGQLAPLAAGARVVYGGPPLPTRLVDGIRRAAVTRAVLVPALFEALADDVLDGLRDDGLIRGDCRAGEPAELAAALRRLNAEELARVRAAVRTRLGEPFRTVTIGGAATSPSWSDVLTLLGLELDLGYGLTEAGPVVTLGRAAECPPGSAGRPLPGVAVRIGPGGEVLVRSQAVMQGYFGDEAATAEAFDGSWLRTGDRGWVDEAGHLFITGRIKDAMVTSAGETIYPDEIEPWYASPLFAEHAVVPRPTPDGNDSLLLVVVPAAAAGEAAAVERAAAALRAAAPARLRVAGVIRRAEPLPRTAVGKIRRCVLAAECAAHEVLS